MPSKYHNHLINFIAVDVLDPRQQISWLNTVELETSPLVAISLTLIVNSMKFAYFKRKIQTGRVDFSESVIQMFNAGESLVPKSPDEMAAQPRPTENNAAASAAAAASARGISSDESDRRCSIRFG